MNKNICSNCKSQKFKTIKKNEIYRCRKCNTIFDVVNRESITEVEAEVIDKIDYSELKSIDTDFDVVINKERDDREDKRRIEMFDTFIKYMVFNKAVNDNDF